tara:strand:+ start:174 stop:665 length:492 start_codon:yes stop_codon:yes gene_type:complete
MTEVFFGIGSNIKPEENIILAVREIKNIFDDVTISPVYKNKSVGFEGNDFLNLVISCSTKMSVYEVTDFIEQAHNLSGREKKSNKYLSRTLDIDLLMFGDHIIQDSKIHIPRDDILKYSFVLKPLVDIAPESVHPVTKSSFREHWERMDKTENPLIPVEIKTL